MQVVHAPASRALLTPSPPCWLSPAFPAHCLACLPACLPPADVEEGGETAFPHSRWLDRERQTAGVKYSDCAKDGVAALPRKGNAVMFWDTKVGGGQARAHLFVLACSFMRCLFLVLTRAPRLPRPQLGTLNTATMPELSGSGAPLVPGWEHTAGQVVDACR